MSTFDAFAESFAWWAETANPKGYDELIGDDVPARVGRALDVGCGPGFLAEWLAPRSGLVTGIDVSGAMIRIARRRLADLRNVNFIEGDIEHPPFADGTFDVVVSDTAIHDTNMDVSLPALRSLLAPGGTLIVRDIITFDPRRARSPIWQLMGTARNVPAYLRRHGVVTTARLLRFEASPAWVRHRADGSELTPAAFERVFSAHFPGSEIRRRAWFMTAVWRSPS